MNKREIIAYFDARAPEWDARMVRSDSKIAFILDAAGVRPGVSVLDVACGTGVLFGDYLARDAARVTGVDISPEMARIAVSKLRDPRVEVLCGDVEELALPRRYDCCVVYNAFPHFAHPARLLARLSACLSPGGRLTVAHGFKVTSGPVLDKPGDLAGVLTSLEPNDVLFIDEIHRLSPVVEEYLYSAMEDYRIDIMIDKGPSARSIQIDLNPFTLVGATTRSGLLTAPLRARFGINLHLEYYDDDILSNIIRRSASILDVPCSVRAASEIASRSRGTPRIANALLRRVRDFAQVKGSGSIDTEIAQFALEALNIDKYGLDEIDNKILCTIIDKFKGGPVGITTIATALGEDAGTIEEVYEPFLIKEGFMKRTPRGREVTELAYKHLGRSLYNSQKTLFND